MSPESLKLPERTVSTRYTRIRPVGNKRFLNRNRFVDKDQSCYVVDRFLRKGDGVLKTSGNCLHPNKTFIADQVRRLTPQHQHEKTEPRTLEIYVDKLFAKIGATANALR